MNENRLRIEKFTWEYTKEISFDFSPGFNIFGGTENQALRTIVLRLIRFSMGSRYSRLDREILENSMNVSLEVLAGNEKITMIRNCQQPSAMLNVIDENNSYRFNSYDLAGNYLMKKLRLPQLIKERKEGVYRLTLNDLARSFVIDRDISYWEILSGIPKEDRIQIMKIMLGISTVETGPLEIEEKRIKGLIKSLEIDIKAVKKFLQEMDVPKMETIITLERENKSRKEQLITKEVELRRQIRDKTVRRKKSTYDKLRFDLLSQREMLRNMETELNTLRFQKKRKLDLRKRLEAEYDRINRHISSESVLSSFSFSICPRCLQEIDSQMKEREIQDRCMLCGREFMKRKPSMAAWEKSLRDVEQNLGEIDELIEFYEEREKEISSRIKSLREEIGRIGSEIEDETKEYVSESVGELKLLSTERMEVEKMLEKLENWKKQRRYVRKVENEELPRKEKELENLINKLDRISKRRESKKRRIETFLSHFSEFMRKVVPNSFNSAGWDREEYLPLVNKQKYTGSMIGYDLTSTVIAFHYALLAMKFKEPRVDTNHPGLLIIDEPEQQRMPEKTFLKIMALLKNLAESYEDSIQIIVAATTVPDGMEEFVIKF